MSLRRSYTLIAPLYDTLVAAATRNARGESLAGIAADSPSDVLLAGIGTGLDLPHLTGRHRYTGLDLTAAMLRRARARPVPIEIRYVLGDVQCLPFPDASYDIVVLHLILAVVPDARRCLNEAARVVRPGGSVLIFDKFLRPGERSWWKRAINPLARRLATRFDVVFEDLLSAVPNLMSEYDKPALAGGWFRLIRLRKAG